MCSFYSKLGYCEGVVKEFGEKPCFSHSVLQSKNLYPLQYCKPENLFSTTALQTLKPFSTTVDYCKPGNLFLLRYCKLGDLLPLQYCKPRNLFPLSTANLKAFPHYGAIVNLFTATVLHTRKTFPTIYSTCTLQTQKPFPMHYSTVNRETVFHYVNPETLSRYSTANWETCSRTACALSVQVANELATKT